jgi:hypothetical protein
MKVKFIHTEKDNQNDNMNCTECNASLKHGMIINGLVYGLDCGAKKLGWTTKAKAQINKKVSTLERAASNYRTALANPKSDWEVYAGVVCELYGLTISRFDPDFKTKVLEAIS